MRGKHGVGIIGHRGARGHAPENTLASFERAIDLGADIIECDVRLSRDGVPAVIHDATLDRTTDGLGPVAGRSFADLRRLDAGRWFGRGAFAGQRVPALPEVLDLARGRCGVAVDIKAEGPPGIEEVVLEAVRRAGMEAATLLISFDAPLLQRIKERSPPAWTGFSFKRLPAEPASLARDLGIHGLVPQRGAVTPELISSARAAGLVVAPWTVDRPGEMRRLMALGVDAIITNYPDRLRRLQE